LALPRVALENSPEAAVLLGNSEVPVIKFTDPDPFQEFSYPNALAAKRAIADYLGIALAKLPPEQLDWINALVSRHAQQTASPRAGTGILQSRAQKGSAMLSDVRNYYGLAKDFGQAGYFETEHSEQIVRELKLEIKAGKLLALSGIIGSGACFRE
jgi:ABC-type glutathione transport system ATPase component